MLISGIEKFSMIDYPGKISCVIFTLGCNMRCGFCHNSDFVLPEKVKEMSGNLIAQEAFFKFLETRIWLLDGVSICGWEPTLQKDLIMFCRRVKDMWFSVKLDTNGRDPELLKKLIDSKLIDYIAMDIKNPLWKFDEITGVDEDEIPYHKSIELLLKSDIDYEFRTTVIQWVHTQEDIESIAKSLPWAQNYYLQNYRAGKTLQPDFIGTSFNEYQLEEFKKIASKYVIKVWIRN